MSFFYLLKQSLNVIPIILCGFAKVPQIKKSLRLKTTAGLSFTNLIIELYCWTVNLSYFIYHEYAYINFLEYPLLLLQQMGLISMHLKFTKTVKTPVAAFINFTYLWLLYNMALGPEWVLQILIGSCPAIGAFGKICQIYEIIKTSRGDLVSKLPFMSNALTSFTRLVTVWMDTQDINLYINFGISVILNFSVIISALMCVPKKEKLRSV